YLITLHGDVEGVPFPNRIVRYGKGFAGMFLVIVQTPGTYLCPYFFIGNVPDLYLWGAAEAYARMSHFRDLPVYRHLKISIFRLCIGILSFPGKDQQTVTDFPALTHHFIGLILPPGKFCRRHGLSFYGIGYQTFPAFEALP